MKRIALLYVYLSKQEVATTETSLNTSFTVLQLLQNLRGVTLFPMTNRMESRIEVIEMTSF